MSFTLQEQLASLAIPRLTTVLRVNFALQDGKRSFEQASELIEKWWSRKAVPYGQVIASSTVDLDFVQGDFKVDFARSENEFVLSMQEPDSSLERVWLCDFALRRAGLKSEFGVRLSYRQPYSLTARPDPRAPRFLQDLVDVVGAVDVRAMETNPRRISLEDLPFFMDLVQSPVRTLPVIAVSEESFTGKVYADADKLAKTLAGTAHVFRLDPAASWQLSRDWGPDLSTFQGALRAYSPGFTKLDDKFKHRLWLSQGILRFDANARSGFLNACAAHVFTQVTAYFEPFALLTPSSVRRRLAAAIQEGVATSSAIPIVSPAMKVVITPTLPDAVVQPVSSYVVEVSALEAVNRDLVERLARLQEEAKTLEDARDQERAARAESEARLEENQGLLSSTKKKTTNCFKNETLHWEMRAMSGQMP